MAKGYIPRQDTLFFRWQEQLVKEAVNNAGSWNIPAAAITEVQQQQSVYEPLYRAITNRGTRSMSQVAAHRSGRQEYEKYLRQFARQWITHNTAISPAQRVTAGVNPGGKKRSQRPVITDQPFLMPSVQGGQRIKITCRMTHDSNRPNIPPNADAVELRYSIGTEPAAPGQCTHMHLSTRAVFTLQFEGEQAGQRLYLFARWVNLKQQQRSGPYTNLRQLMIA